VNSESPKVSELQKHFAWARCFVCGPAHEHGKGLGLIFEETEDGAMTRFRLDSGYHSYPGVLHGGVSSAILDETIAYASMFKYRLLPFTRSLQLFYRRNVRPGKEYRCVARITEHRADGFKGEGSIEDMNGLRHLTASGDFVYPTLSMAKRMMPDVDVEPMREFFRP
jgi:acyl-coenzyme A thioesterase PaaI-like protein